MSGDFDWRNDSQKNVLIVSTQSKPNGFWVSYEIKRLVDELDIDAYVEVKNLLDSSGDRLDHHGVATAILTRSHEDFITLMVALEHSAHAERLDAIESYRKHGDRRDFAKNWVRERLRRSSTKSSSAFKHDTETSKLKAQFERDQTAALAVKAANDDLELLVAKWSTQTNENSTPGSIEVFEVSYEESYWDHSRARPSSAKANSPRESETPEERDEHMRERIFGERAGLADDEKRNALDDALAEAQLKLERATTIARDEEDERHQRATADDTVEQSRRRSIEQLEDRINRRQIRFRDDFSHDRDDGFEHER